MLKYIAVFAGNMNIFKQDMFGMLRLENIKRVDNAQGEIHIEDGTVYIFIGPASSEQRVRRYLWEGKVELYRSWEVSEAARLYVEHKIALVTSDNKS